MGKREYRPNGEVKPGGRFNTTLPYVLFSISTGKGTVSHVRMKDFMTPEASTLNPGDTLRRAVELFRRTRLDGIPAVDGQGCLVGLLTRTNLFDALLEGYGLDDPVDDLLTRKVVTVDLDMPYQTVVREVKKSPVGMGVVVDENNRVRGALTKVDMIMALFRESDLLNARLRAVYQAMHNGLVSVDNQGCITMLNPAAEVLLGVQEKEVLGCPVEKVLPGLNLSNIMVTGQVEVSKKYEAAGRAFLVNCTPVLDGGNTVGAMAIFQDLTELEQVAAELESVRTLQHTLRTVLDIAYDGIVVVDKEGYITFFNQSLADFFGLAARDAIGRHVTDVLENSRLHIVARTGVPETAQLQQVGGSYYVVSRLPIVENGRVVGAVGKIMFRNLEEIRELARRMDNLESQLSFYREELQKNSGSRFTFDSIITVSPAMVKLKGEALQAARGISTVLIRGASGTGKELFAQAIHTASPRREGPFVKVNCAAIPEHLMESEFFGYAPGAFTGAMRGGKPGRFELAHGGTIFLDEIGDMSPGLQAKLLRVLQDREFDRVGGTHPVQVDVRVVAATNRELEEMVARGDFREDLFYRLNVIALAIPPLRERPEDILPLVHYFLRKYNNIFGARVTDLDHEALEILKAHHWPGNVRELENVIERAVNFVTGSIIRVKDLPAYLRREKSDPGRRAGGSNYRARLDDVEREIIQAALKSTRGNKTQAARMLGISRSRLYVKLKKLDS
ncbi:sigma-54-dependent Fis family transcriptional regulator [Desulfallas thermosapovorans]|uniref:PAS domain S-box-containing protein n=1 Tax=Desulfallas thermosapovorans DSM 6562 TaxID=1121431 RepID=A0A5S4ZNJ7_9FIRM|nr:sigma-54-dependent Fis family transcriptional regulator [Desulfallas thermosapovorans]TYO93303.1 PAS domain S-box-containing protein [Desulfallas thermosapovorans DSM 6562]